MCHASVCDLLIPKSESGRSFDVKGDMMFLPLAVLSPSGLNLISLLLSMKGGSDAYLSFVFRYPQIRRCKNKPNGDALDHNVACILRVTRASAPISPTFRMLVNMPSPGYYSRYRNMMRSAPRLLPINLKAHISRLPSQLRLIRDRVSDVYLVLPIHYVSSTRPRTIVFYRARSCYILIL